MCITRTVTVEQPAVSLSALTDLGVSLNESSAAQNTASVLSVAQSLVGVVAGLPTGNSGNAQSQVLVVNDLVNDLLMTNLFPGGTPAAGLAAADGTAELCKQPHHQQQHRHQWPGPTGRPGPCIPRQRSQPIVCQLGGC